MVEEFEQTRFQASPNTVPWPPIILISAVIIGWLMNSKLQSFAGIPMVGHYLIAGLLVWSGWLLIALAIAMDVWVLMIFKTHETNIRPDRPAESLVNTGPFAYSRNPVYVGNVAIMAGLAMVSGSLWYLLLAIAVFFLIQELAIKREEQHLAVRFGENWSSYSASVRRWL